MNPHPPVLVSVSAVERAEPYVAALHAVGLERVKVITPRDGAGASAHGREALTGAAGLVLCGGADVDPSRYGEPVAPGASVKVVPERDLLEWELIAAARAARLPVWGICRGLQVLNVFFGGSLWQDLPSQVPVTMAPPPLGPADLPHLQTVLPPVRHALDGPPDALAHALRVTAPGSALGEQLGRAPARVNSRHHQGIRALAPALVAVAVAPDGLIEAVELDDPAGAVGFGAAGSPGSRDFQGSQGSHGAEDSWWLRAVQWHPEDLIAMAQQRALWEDFAKAVRQTGAARLALAG